MYCVRAGEPCVRHGGERSSIEASKRYEARQEAAPTTAQAAVQPATDQRAARELPKPTSLTQPVPDQAQELDRELAAISTILAALDGLTADEVKRALAYVADRKGIRTVTGAEALGATHVPLSREVG